MALAADKLKDLFSIVTRLLPQTTTVPDLAADEVGVELDTGKLKVGDGTTPWASLPYLTAGGGSGATGATGPTGPAGGGGNTTTVTVHLNTAAINTLNSNPVQIVAGQGSGTVIDPKSMFVQYVFNTTGFANDPRLNLFIDNGVLYIPDSGFPYTLTGADGTENAVNSAPSLARNSTSAVAQTALEDQPLMLIGNNDNDTGDGDLYITVTYSVITLQ